MHIKRLQHFESLFRLKSFVRAAEEQNLSQPAFTKSIQQLESDLNVQLFDRSTRSVEPTHAGSQLIDKVRRTLLEVDELHAEAAALHGKRLGKISVGCGPFPMTPLLTDACYEFGQSNPSIQIELSANDTATLLRLLIERRLDLIVCDASKYEFSAFADEIDIQPLAREPIVLVYHRHHWLAKTPVTDKALSECRWASPSPSPHFLRFLSQQQRAGAAKGSYPHYLMSSTSACFEMARLPGIITAAPISAAQRACQNSELEFQMFPDRRCTNDAIHTLRKRSLSPVALDFVQLLQGRAKDNARIQPTPV